MDFDKPRREFHQTFRALQKKAREHGALSREEKVQLERLWERDKAIQLDYRMIAFTIQNMSLPEDVKIEVAREFENRLWLCCPDYSETVCSLLDPGVINGELSKGPTRKNA